MDKKKIEVDMLKWRHELHQIPEEGMKEYKTAAYVAARLEDMGLEVFTGIGGTGVVGKLTAGSGKGSVGLRADFDALPCRETNALPYVSKHEGWMHGCGHDGHTAMLLGAAEILSEARDFDGTVYFVFQPGEEPGIGARAMAEDGLFDRFPMDAIYGMHNETQFPFGTFRTRAGSVKTSEDDFTITIHGKGGHASAPHLSKDPIVIAAEVIIALQTIVSRMTAPLESVVISCTDINANGVPNTIATDVVIKGDCRCFKAEHQDLVETKMRAIVDSICSIYDATGEVDYQRNFLPTVNDAGCAAIAAEAAWSVLGDGAVIDNCSPDMSSEDFSVFGQYVPSCYSFLGTAVEGRPETQYPLHSPYYDFNDDILLTGAEVYAEMARVSLKEKK